MASKVYVVKHDKDKGVWNVQREDAKNPSAKFERKPDAVKRGRELAQKISGQLKVLKTDGKVQEERNYAPAAPAKKAPAKKAPAKKKATARKPAKKAPAKKAAVKKAPAKKAPAKKKTTARKPAAKKTTRKPAAKKTTTRRKK